MSRCGSHSNAWAPNLPSSERPAERALVHLVPEHHRAFGTHAQRDEDRQQVDRHVGPGRCLDLLQHVGGERRAHPQRPAHVRAADQPSSCSSSTPNLAKVRSSSGNCADAPLRTATLPPVIAPSARKVATSWKSSAKVYSAPPQRIQAVHRAAASVPVPAMRRAHLAQERAELLHVRLARGVGEPRAAARRTAHSTKFSVVVTEA